MYKVNILYLILTIMAGIFAYAEGGNLPYVIFYVLLVSFVVALVTIIKYKRNLEVKVGLQKQIYSTGENDELTMIIRNQGIIPVPYMIVKNSALGSINGSYRGDAISLGIDDNLWIKNKIKFSHRGEYDFGDIYMEISDFFNIFTYTLNMSNKKPVKVYPRIYELEKIEAKGMDIFKNTLVKKSGIEDMYNLSEVREYREGDSLKRVHWKVSAKQGDLYVKNFDTVSGEEGHLFLDMSMGNFQYDRSGMQEEQMIDFFSSLIFYMVEKGVKSKLHINDSHGKSLEINGRTDFDELLDYFVKQKSDGQENFVRFIHSRMGRIPKLSWIGIVTPKVNLSLKDSLITLRDLGYGVTVFYCEEDFESKQNHELLSKIGVDCINYNSLLKIAGK